MKKRIKKNTSIAALSAAMVIGSGTVLPAQAGEWDLSMSLSEEVVYDDNLFLRTNTVDEVYGSITRGRVGYSRTTPKSETGISANIAALQYWGALEDNTPGNLDSVDPGLSVTHKRRGRASVLSFEAGVQRQNTREAELDDSGRLIDDAYRDTYTASVFAGLRRGRRDEVGVRASYREVSYNVDTLIDYRVYDVAGVWTRDVTPQSRVSLAVGGQQLEVRNRQGEQDESLFATLSLITNPTEVLDLRAYVGVRQIYGNDIDTVIAGAGDEDTLGLVFGSSVSYEPTPRLTTSLAFDRQISPSSTGLTQETWRFQGNAAYELTPALSANLRTIYFRREDLFGSLSNSREYYEIAPGLSYELGRNWDLFARYRFRTQKTSATAGWADSNAVLIGARWRYQER